MSILKKIFSIFGALLVIACIAVLFVWYFTMSAPGQIKIDEPRFGTHGAAVVRIEDGVSIARLAEILKEKQIIRSPKMFLTLVEKLNFGKSIKKGTYVFSERQNIFQIASRFKNAEYGYTPVKVTIPEGYSTKDMAKILPSKLVDIKAEDFILLATPFEGYLFPDTYFFYPYATSSDVVGLLNRTFEKKIASLENEFNANFDPNLNTASSSTVSVSVSTLDSSSTSSSTSSAITDDSTSTNLIKRYGPRSKEEIIILASILEKEVQTADDMALVADLFLKRIEEGMPLQADSTLTYYTGKTSGQLTLDDLKSDSPYNSYVYKGLPPTPISNPGIKAIKAALNPVANPYFFFLSDRDGVTHFAKTYKEHLRLKDKYLR